LTSQLQNIILAPLHLALLYIDTLTLNPKPPRHQLLAV